MAYIEWTGALRIGISDIDAQHQRLVALINELAAAREMEGDAAKLGTALTSLAEYAATHFALEESLFKRFDYPGAEPHAREHAAFAARVAGFAAALAAGEAKPEELLTFLKTWLTTHISFSDKKYAPFLKERGRE
ncbi:MAG: hemerythrin family protein [Spirochaetaceae bacterium]|nr:hemerythrin family protein [Spirochaetaceae bacterium]